NGKARDTGSGISASAWLRAAGNVRSHPSPARELPSRLHFLCLPNHPRPPSSADVTGAHTITHVAIVEDNPALGGTLRKVVESDPSLRCIGVWSSAEDALKKIDAFRPEIVLMDINLPGMSGIEATARLKQHLPDVKVVMVTVYRDHDKIFSAL